MAEQQILNHDRRSSKGSQLQDTSKWRRHKDHVVHLFETIMKSYAWKGLIVFFTIVLLFGSPIQILFTPKEADGVFDILYTVALFVFVMDMIFNMCVDPNYLGLQAFRRNRAQPFDQAKFFSYGIGSFNMWCDVASTAALFYDISYTNPLQNEEEIVYLNLDQYGLLVRIYQSSYGFSIVFKS